MSDIYKAKVFKSGNSVAIRLPKAMGIPEGTEMQLVKEDRMTFRVEPVEPPRKTIDISGFAGKLPGFKPAPREDFEERPSAVAARKAAEAQQ